MTDSKKAIDKLVAANYHSKWLALANQNSTMCLVTAESICTGGKYRMPLNLTNAGETQIIRKIGGSPEVKKAPGKLKSLQKKVEALHDK